MLLCPTLLCSILLHSTPFNSIAGHVARQAGPAAPVPPRLLGCPVARLPPTQLPSCVLARVFCTLLFSPLYSTLLYFTPLHSTLLHSTPLHYILLCSSQVCSNVLHCTLPCSLCIVLFCTMCRSRTRCNRHDHPLLDSTSQIYCHQALVRDALLWKLSLTQNRSQSGIAVGHL